MKLDPDIEFNKIRMLIGSLENRILYLENQVRELKQKNIEDLPEEISVDSFSQEELVAIGEFLIDAQKPISNTKLSILEMAGKKKERVDFNV